MKSKLKPEKQKRAGEAGIFSFLSEKCQCFSIFPTQKCDTMISACKTDLSRKFRYDFKIIVDKTEKIF